MKDAIDKLKAELEIVGGLLKEKQDKLQIAQAVHQDAQSKVLELQIKHKGLTDAIATLEGGKK